MIMKAMHDYERAMRMLDIDKKRKNLHAIYNPFLKQPWPNDVHDIVTCAEPIVPKKPRYVQCRAMPNHMYHNRSDAKPVCSKCAMCS
jgi:hypothetical protein